MDLLADCAASLASVEQPWPSSSHIISHRKLGESDDGGDEDEMPMGMIPDQDDGDGPSKYKHRMIEGTGLEVDGFYRTSQEATNEVRCDEYGDGYDGVCYRMRIWQPGTGRRDIQGLLSARGILIGARGRWLDSLFVHGYG